MIVLDMSDEPERLFSERCERINQTFQIIMKIVEYFACMEIVSELVVHVHLSDFIEPNVIKLFYHDYSGSLSQCKLTVVGVVQMLVFSIILFADERWL